MLRRESLPATSCQSGMTDSNWFSPLLQVIVPSSNWLPDVYTYGDNLQSAICRVRAVCHHFPASLRPSTVLPRFPPPVMSGCGVPSIKQATISGVSPSQTSCVDSTRMRLLLRPGPDRWPLPPSLASHTNAFSRRVRSFVFFLVTCFRISLILSLRAAAELHPAGIEATQQLVEAQI